MYYWMKRSLTVPHDISLWAFYGGEHGRPSGKVRQVEFDVVVFREAVQICQVEVEEVKRTEWSD